MGIKRNYFATAHLSHSESTRNQLPSSLDFPRLFSGPHSIKTVSKWSTSSYSCELPCSGLNNSHHISRPQTAHPDSVFLL